MSLEDKLYPFLRLYDAAPQSVKTLAGRAYRNLPQSLRLGPAYARFKREAQAAFEWDRDEVERYQIEALRETLKAAAAAPFYAAKFAEAGVDPSAFESLAQLREYPMLEKQDLQQDREAMVCPLAGESQQLFLTTGGSTGMPVGFYLQKGVSRPKEQACLEVMWSRFGYQSGDRVAVIRGGTASFPVDGRIHSYDATRDWLNLSSCHLTPDRVPEYVETLNRFRPLHLHAYPSAALMLAQVMEELGLRLDFEFTSVLCGSEKLTGGARHCLEQFFQAPVCHWYGHSERVVLAGQGGEGWELRFWPTYGLVEFGSPDEEGLCEVIGTSFHNHVMPLVRYRTGDRVRLSRSPGQTPGWPAVEEVAGRDHEFVVSKTGRRVSLTAINPHDEVFEGLLAVQFVQEVAGEVDFLYQPGARWLRAKRDVMHAALARKLGDEFALRLREVDQVQKTASGKHRWLVSSLRETTRVL